MGAPVKGGTVLFSEMTPPDGGEDAFNDWYDNHHSPSHVQGVPGFLSAQRYRSPHGPHYLAVYELESPETLEHKEYTKRKFTPDAETKDMLDRVSGFTRYVANGTSTHVKDDIEDEAIDADVVIAVLFTAPPERWPELMQWYDTEHAPLLMENPDWLMIRLMEIYDYTPSPMSHLFLHYVRDASVLESAELAAARDSVAQQARCRGLVRAARRHLPTARRAFSQRRLKSGVHRFHSRTGRQDHEQQRTL